jgi:hypothetical protein
MAKILIFFSFLYFLPCFINADLTEYLKTYEVINPRIRSLTSKISRYSMHFSFNAFNQTFILLLQTSEIPSVHSNFRLLDAYGKDKSHKLLSSFTYYEGFLSGFPHTTISMTMSKDNDDVMGRIDTENETFYIEHPPILNQTIIYRSSDVMIDLSEFKPHGHNLLVPECTPTPHYFEPYLSRTKRAVQGRPVRKNRCEMKLVADYEFYKVIGNNNYYSAARYLVLLLYFRSLI